MATPPTLKTSLSSSRPNLHLSPSRKAFDLRTYAIHQIGHANFKGFELWAFKADSVVIYDDTIIWKWNNVHNKDLMSPGNTRDCLDSMIAIWKARFAPDEEEEQFPIEIDFKDSPRSQWPGPGLDDGDD